MADIEVGILQDDCIARNRESWTDVAEGEEPECMVDVAFNNGGVISREYISQKLTKLTCGCIIIDDNGSAQA